MNAAEVANSVSEGTNALSRLLARLASSNTPRTYAAELAGDLLTLILALEALRGSEGSEPPDDAVGDCRRLHALVVEWRDTGIVSPHVEALATRCLTLLGGRS
ncbi:hypothetical protein AKJ09_00539 [Labilithrix luteola]|uniref:Uncharacterized protein n=1 Tax=Labilithrix luteola TaxID=1391654 RepID=A0A0K1PK21_9BACT|nr:hypothetical protein [Labilithrix luteola]AKU93875.1 hypothetical protein AKJ09_00539 [Labilithrix luteola]